MGLSERQARSAGSPAMTGNIMRSIHTATSAVKEQAVAADEARLPKLRVLFVTEDDPIYVIRFFDLFCGISAGSAGNLRDHNRPGFSRADLEDAGPHAWFYGPWGTFSSGAAFHRCPAPRPIDRIARQIGGSYPSSRRDRSISRNTSTWSAPWRRT